MDFTKKLMDFLGFRLIIRFGGSVQTAHSMPPLISRCEAPPVSGVHPRQQNTPYQETKGPQSFLVCWLRGNMWLEKEHSQRCQRLSRCEV